MPPHQPTSVPRGRTTPIFHTCTHNVDFFIDAEIARLLCKDLSIRPQNARYRLPYNDPDLRVDDAAGFPPLGTSTDFDAWIHAVLLSVRGLYNAV